MIKQTKENLCGTIAAIHILAHKLRDMPADSPVAEFLALVGTGGDDPSLKGEKLAGFTDILLAHNKVDPEPWKVLLP